MLPVAVQAKVVGRYAERANASLVRAASVASETLLQLRTIAAFGLEARAVDAFTAELSLSYKQDVLKGASSSRAMRLCTMAVRAHTWDPSVGVALGVGSGTAAGTILFAAAFQYVVGALFFDADLISFSDIMSCLLVLIFMAFGFATVSRDVSDRAEAMQAARRVYKLVSTPSAIDALAGTGDVPPSGRAAGRIELVEVSFAYPARRDVQVYQGLSLTIEPGATVALAGPSGCGKSTLVALLERWYDVDGGRVVLDGADVRSLSVRWLRSQIGLVSQEPVLFNGTIAYNIGLGAAAAGEGGGEGSDGEGGDEAAAAAVEVAARQANAHAFVSAMPDGYATEVGDKGVQLSGGQKQRIAIARALVRDPPILVLDEATSALDAESERIVQAALDELLRAQRRTTIVIAHRLSTIRNADKIAVVSGGRVVEEGPHDELVNREGGIYRSLVLHNNAGRDEL